MKDLTFKKLERIVRTYFKEFFTEMTFHQFGEVLILEGEREKLISELTFNLDDWNDNCKYNRTYSKFDDLKSRIVSREKNL